jgi:transposase
MSAVKPKRRYSQTFKVNAVRRCSVESATTAEIAQQLGIPEDLLLQWKRELADTQDKVAPSTQTGSSARDAELQRMREEQQRLMEEIAILRAAAMRGSNLKR